MTDCHCECLTGTCALAEEPIQVGLECGCQTYTLDWRSTGVVTLGLDEDGNFTGDIIVSPDEGNILLVENDGLFLPVQVIASESGASSATWTETTSEFTPRQTTSLALPEGKWFVSATWRAQAELANVVPASSDTSDPGARFIYRMFIDTFEGALRQYRWNDTQGILLHIDDHVTSITLGDAFGATVEGDQTISVGIDTAIDPADTLNEVLFTASRVVAYATRIPEEA